ncbi:MAG: hypothetical protein BJ554DRAFT_4458 [Olpidium bornovanus]|uniref:IFT81 calponin homology domain-containing protein n=1 Tax=Olpidium bornovanus TaxID=278681 RepID=A0A8H7ZMQ2_9FUNG|nr:MAG: hypothetical protein BJ554DRAFT_4458 [Olpidium bornovanus]
MPSTEELNLAAEVLKAPPFSQKVSVIQLHDEAPVLQLCNLVNTVLKYIDEKNPNSQHNVDLRSEPPEETINRILSFVAMLKYPAPGGL